MGNVLLKRQLAANRRTNNASCSATRLHSKTLLKALKDVQTTRPKEADKANSFNHSNALDGIGDSAIFRYNFAKHLKVNGLQMSHSMTEAKQNSPTTTTGKESMPTNMSRSLQNAGIPTNTEA